MAEEKKDKFYALAVLGIVAVVAIVAVFALIGNKQTVTAVPVYSANAQGADNSAGMMRDKCGGLPHCGGGTSCPAGTGSCQEGCCM